jgi:hypothetical protein
VIIGWDEIAQAPEEWLKEHSVSFKKKLNLCINFDL